MTATENSLTHGLLAGYGGKTELGGTNRGGFPMKTSHYESGAVTYHDEWFAGSNGGGQELVNDGNVAYTRVYAGGVINQDELVKLGISEKDIIGELIERIKELGPLTRLFANCTPEKHGHWNYSYTVLNTSPETGVTIAKEVITYNDTIVFVHGFVLSPLR